MLKFFKEEFGFYAAANIMKIFFGFIKPNYKLEINKHLQKWRQNKYFVVGNEKLPKIA